MGQGNLHGESLALPGDDLTTAHEHFRNGKQTQAHRPELRYSCPVNDRELGSSLRAKLMKAAIHHGAATLAELSRRAFVARGGMAPFVLHEDLPYGSKPEQLLDVWVPRASSPGLRPVVLLLHAGGFQHLDKRSHWSFAERFARAGAVVFNADYRLAPTHRYPAAAEDAELAYRYTVERAHAFGGDPTQLIVAGVSAGGNLALGLAISHAEDTTPPRASVLFSGLLQVSDMPRLYRARRWSSFMRARIASINCEYPAADASWHVPAQADPLLDPLLYLEQQQTLPLGLAPAFISTGSADEVLGDSLRLRACLAEHQRPVLLDVVPGAGHAFQGLMFKAGVPPLWERCIAFLRAHGAL
jgi:acetyl esterase